MKTFKHNIRLRTGSALIIFLMVVLSSFAIYNMHGLSSLTNKLFRHPYTVSTAVLRIEHNVSAVRSTLKDIELAKERQAIPTLQNRINALIQNIHGDFKIVQERFLGDMAMVQAAQQSIADWEPVIERAIAQALKGDPTLLHSTHTDNGRASQQIHTIMQSMQALSDFAKNKANEFHGRALKERDQALNITYLFVAACIFIGYWSSRTTVSALREVISAVSSSSSQMAATINEQERISSQQATSVTETNTTMEELGASSQQSADQAASAASNAQKALQLTDEGRSQMNAMVQSMEETQNRVEAIANQILTLSEQTSQIGSITNAVTDFANETKMLAMNAAVEAVRAGEHGKGFSVLSVEIRKLAEESKRSAERINNLVEEIQKATNTTVMVTEEGSKTVRRSMKIAQRTEIIFQDVAGAISESSQSAQQISMNINQQAIAVKQVVEAMRNLTTGAKEASNGIQQVKVGIHTLNRSAAKLNQMT